MTTKVDSELDHESGRCGLPADSENEGGPEFGEFPSGLSLRVEDSRVALASRAGPTLHQSQNRAL
jgi:hypothetical protein